MMTAPFRFLLFAIFSSYISSETCRDASQYSECSTNKDCGCFPLATSDKSGICGFLWVACSRLDPCQTPGNTCEKLDHKCVRHPQCNSAPVCYPISMIDKQICPSSEDTTSPSVPNNTICTTATWSRQGISVAGGFGWGNALNQLYYPMGIFVDVNRTVYVADTNNARVVKWTQNATFGQIVAGGYGVGSGTAQFYGPMDLVVDKDGAIYVTDNLNNRVQKWNRNAQVGQTVMIVQRPIGIALDGEESLYVSASYWSKDLLKLRKGETNGNVIATNLPELYYLFAHQNQSIYAADKNNGRIYRIDEKKGQISVIIGSLQGLSATQLGYPQSVLVDGSGAVYVVEYGHHRVTRWLPGANAGIAIAGGRSQGYQSDQLNFPTDIAFDVDGNLYVADYGNHRVQKFAIDKSTCR
ncbi:unnamed protein product [Rotaria magnacalcarata]|uniref:Uncharacterized protein n=1 Tax=Rotaria magnacalcarata TaxID=392030 RepID=A0A816QFH3_9BILA|nr:unnamed protein product [Rotaria magnacalcarata]CAF2061227.1 unnamed protein product [Rotaria magnacalcarata]CAF4191424.1 unnamed protein product [Rotaria magnacalcarata]